MTTPDSTPLRNEVEQPVQQKVLELVRCIQWTPGQTSGFALSEARAAALILAAMERFAEQKTAELRTKLEDEKKLGTQWLMRAHDAEEQLAALQRENETLKRSPENARYHRTATSEKEGK